MLARQLWPSLTMCALAVAPPAALSFGSRLASAQTGAVLRGVVLDSMRLPISGAEVSLLEAHAVANTDSAGVFILRDVPPGTYSVFVRHPRYHPLDGTLQLAAGDSLDLPSCGTRATGVCLPRMRRVAVALDTVKVQDSTLRPWWQSEFEHRKVTTHGTFITSDVLEQRAASDVASIIASKATGVKMILRQCGGGMSCGYALASSVPAPCASIRCPPSPACFLAVYLDGQPIYLPRAGESAGVPPDLSRDYKTDELAAIEVYVGSASIPPVFNQSGSSCGVVALWRKTAGTKS